MHASLIGENVTPFARRKRRSGLLRIVAMSQGEKRIQGIGQLDGCPMKKCLSEESLQKMAPFSRLGSEEEQGQNMLFNFLNEHLTLILNSRKDK